MFYRYITVWKWPTLSESDFFSCWLLIKLYVRQIYNNLLIARSKIDTLATPQPVKTILNFYKF